MTFLAQTAEYIFSRHQTRMDDVWVVLPTRRAVLVFQQQLARLSDRPFLAPHTLAVDDFITQAAGVQLIDPVSLLFELFAVFREVDPAVQFEPFVGWASVVLSDFDRIDQYLLNAPALFAYLADAKRIESWNLTLPKGASPIGTTPATTRYFQLFANLRQAYDTLRARLEARGLAYRGMAYRRLAEQVAERVRDNPRFERLYFVGFNALSASEARIIDVLTKADRAELLWDADRYYLDDPSQEAGYFLRRYREAGLPGFRDRSAPDAGDRRPTLGDALTTLPKRIRMIGVPTASMQAKLAGQLYADWLAEEQRSAPGDAPATNGVAEQNGGPGNVVTRPAANVVTGAAPLGGPTGPPERLGGPTLGAGPTVGPTPDRPNLGNVVAENVVATTGNVVEPPDNGVTDAPPRPSERTADPERRSGRPAARRTAIVLADESLLVPVLYSLDESVTDLNVTMGLSLRHSLLFTLVDTLFEMQRTVADIRTTDGRDLRIPKYHHRQVTKLLNHPFVRQYERIRNLRVPAEVSDRDAGRPLLSWICEQIVASQQVYLDEADLLAYGGNDPLFRALFRRWPAGRPTDAIRAFYELIDLLRAVYRDSQDAVEIEYLYLFYSLLQQLETTLEQARATGQADVVTFKSFRQFLYELIRQTSIPFMSEGDSRLQLMGMLETRALDFERVIVLSANEGVLPKARSLNSLIPFDIAQERGLPTYREQESVMAYHFYRLLQRAQDVVLLYTTSPDAYGNSKGEPSRFLRQIEHELVPAAGGRISLSKPAVHYVPPRPAGVPGHVGNTSPAPPNVVELTVPKTDSIRAKLKAYLTDPARGLYPTALNQYIRCSMRFYFDKLVRVSEETDVEERMDAAEFGDWLHKTLETLDLEYRMPGRPVTSDVVKQVLATTYREQMKGRVTETGINLIVYQLAERLMLDFQERQNALPGLRVLHTEKQLATTLPVAVGGELWPVRVAGKIDRIEEYDGQIRIIDYKTGAVNLPKLLTDLPEKLPTTDDKDWEKMRQLWLYKYLVLRNADQLPGLGGRPVTAGFYSFRNLNGGLLANPVQFSPAETPADYVRTSETLLRRLIGELLDPEKPFRKTDNRRSCLYCDYKRICGR